MTNTFGKTVAAGAPADKTSQVMSNGINKGLGAGRIMATTNTYAGEIKIRNSTRQGRGKRDHTMDRDMQHDRTMTEAWIMIETGT